MNILVVGQGRIGLPIAKATRGQGHNTATVASNTAPSEEWLKATDLIVLAAAVEDDRYPDFTSFQASLDWFQSARPDVPIASVTPLTPDQIQQLTDSRPSVRFMCSSAVTDPQSLRFFDQSGEARAVDQLKAALPGAWKAVAQDDFDRYTRLLVASALHCALLSEIEDRIEEEDEERSFLQDTLVEAKRMIEANNDSAEEALASARTPGGLTDTIVSQNHLAQAADALLDGRSRS